MDQRQAMAAFCRDHHRRLVGLVALQVGDRAVAEELAQDVLLRVCEHWSRIDDPWAWSSRVAMRLSASWWRRRYAEWRANTRHGAGRVDAEVGDSAATLAIRRAVAALPERQRQAVAYRYFAGFSVAETAAAMGCADGTVRALTSQGVAALRREFVVLDRDDETEAADVS